jgi:hypothetical protein
MVFVLFAPFGIDPGRLQVTICLSANPNAFQAGGIANARIRFNSVESLIILSSIS